MKGTSAFGGGLVGAVVLNAVHEAVKKIDPRAPRMDLLGMNALSKLLKGMGKRPPEEHKLYMWTMAGDLVSNSLYYSLAGVGSKKNALLRGALLGLSAGLGAVLLPRPLGLNEAPSNRTTETKVMTVALYVLGGLVTAAAMRLFEKKSKSADLKHKYGKKAFSRLSM